MALNLGLRTVKRMISIPATAALRTSAVTNVSVEADFAESWTVLSDIVYNNPLIADR